MMYIKGPQSIADYQELGNVPPVDNVQVYS